MQRITTALLVASALSTAASAEDEKNWTGFYAGVGGAIVSADSDTSTSVAEGLSDTPFVFSNDSSKEAFELMLGYKKDFGPVVVGFELRPTFGGSSSASFSEERPLFQGAPDFLTINTDVDVETKFKGSLMATLGVPVSNRFLFEVGGGFAQAKVSSQGSLSGPYDFFDATIREDWGSFRGSETKTSFIWDVRGTYRVTDSFSVTARYFQADFGSMTGTATLGPDLDLGGGELFPLETSSKTSGFGVNVTYSF